LNQIIKHSNQVTPVQQIALQKKIQQNGPAGLGHFDEPPSFGGQFNKPRRLEKWRHPAGLLRAFRQTTNDQSRPVGKAGTALTRDQQAWVQPILHAQ
jgi:hypothetical protein